MAQTGLPNRPQHNLLKPNMIGVPGILRKTSIPIPNHSFGANEACAWGAIRQLGPKKEFTGCIISPYRSPKVTTANLFF